MDEVTAFRLDSLEAEWKQLISANNDITKGMSSIIVEIDKIYSSLSRLIDVSDKLSERITFLENDLRERSLRKKIYKSIFEFYPLIVWIALFAIGWNHQQISDFFLAMRS